MSELPTLNRQLMIDQLANFNRLTYLILGLWSLCSGTAHGQCLQNTLTPANYSTVLLNPNERPADQAVGDFNGDGKPDLAVANRSSTLVSVFLNTGTGSFGAATNYSLGSNSYSFYSLTIGDFNSDGRLDLAVVKGYPSHAISILLNTGNGNFGIPTDFNVGANPYKVIVGEFDSDGKTDLAVVYGTAPYGIALDVLLNTGTGSFGTPINVTDNLSAPVVIDFNGDAKDDIIVQRGNYISALIGVGNGTFNPPVSLVSISSFSSFTVKDLNTDGKYDIVLCGNANGVTSGQAAIFLNQGNGTFGNSTNYTVGINPNSVVAADFTNDSKIDIAVVSNYENKVSVFTNTGNGSFSSAINYTVGMLPLAAQVNDFNNDGNADIAVLNQQSNSVSLLINSGTGGFGSASNINVDFGASTASDYTDQSQLMLSGDFTNDAKPDLVVIRSPAVSLMPNIGNGDFGAPVNLASFSSGPIALASGDLNGDSKLDLAIGKSGNNSISVILNGSSGISYEVPVGTSFRKIDVGDLNADGKADIVVVPSSSNNLVAVLLNLGNGIFSPATTFTIDLYPLSLKIADVNNDGKPDIITGNQNNTSQTGGTVSVLLNTGSGSFGNATNYTVGVNPVAIASSDLTGDGKPDLITVNVLSNTVSVLINVGNGVFSSAITIPVGTFPVSVAVGDLNSDGKPDLAVGNRSGGNLTILLNTSNGNFSNAATIGVGQKPTTLTSADYNNDGAIDLAVAVTGDYSAVRIVALLYGCPVPVASIQINPSRLNAVCSGSTFSLTAIATVFTPNTYSWSSQPTGFSSSGVTPVFTVPTVTALATYTITVSATDGTVTKTASLTVLVNPATQLYTVKAGIWNDSSTWSCGQIPTSRTNVQLKHLVTIPGNYTANALKVAFDTGVTLQYNPTARLQLSQ